MLQLLQQCFILATVVERRVPNDFNLVFNLQFDSTGRVVGTSCVRSLAMPTPLPCCPPNMKADGRGHICNRSIDAIKFTIYGNENGRWARLDNGRPN